MQWQLFIVPLATALVAFLVGHGANREQIKSLRSEVDSIKGQVEIITRLDMLATEIKSSVRRLHERLDLLEQIVHEAKENLAVLGDRSGFTPVHGVRIYRPKSETEPPITKKKGDK